MYKPQDQDIRSVLFLWPKIKHINDLMFLPRKRNLEMRLNEKNNQFTLDFYYLRSIVIQFKYDTWTFKI